ncbi:hypothetical protein ID866_7888 [Astraeus odoratus]|nr:hypothetical protein ID866_7888 [Astraeus odoratus]
MSTSSGVSEGMTTTIFRAFATIIFSEIGDKTFLIAAILAMRHPRLVVLAGAFGSLLLMSILSAVMGHVLPSLIPKQWTQFAAGVLYLVFGFKMLMEGREMTSDNAKLQEEMQEAEEEIENDEVGAGGSNGNSIPLESMEEGQVPSSPSRRSMKKNGLADGMRNFCDLIFGPVFVQAFVLTFLGEWGDRSQIATIALGATHSVYLVSLGTIIGHMACTTLAVLGGRYVASKISVKHITLGGAMLFLMFGVIYLYESLVASTDDLPIPIAADSISAI